MENPPILETQHQPGSRINSEKKTRPAKSESESRRRKEAGDQIRELGTMLPKAPLNAEELMAAWGVSPREVESLSVIVFRHKLGTPEKELVDHIPVPEYEFRKVARDFGPGTYYLKGSAGKFQTCNAKFVVSEEFARNSGYGRLPDPPPQPPAQDMVAARTLQTVSQAAGIMPENLFAAIERAIENSMDRRLGGHQQVAAQFDPMQAMNNQMAAVEMQWNFMEKMEARARRALMGKIEESEGGEDLSWGSLIKELIKAAPGFIQAMRPMPQPPTTTRVQPADIIVPAAPENQSATSQGSEAVKIIESLSFEDRSIITPAVLMLQPHAGLLARVGSDMNKTPVQIADDMCGWVPPECYPAVIRLSQITAERGPGMLGLIGPEFITERWAEIIHALARNLSEPEG